MAAYEIELRRECGSEFRLTDVPPPLGAEVVIGNRRWCVVDHTAAPVRHTHASVRFVCVESRDGVSGGRTG